MCPQKGNKSVGRCMNIEKLKVYFNDGKSAPTKQESAERCRFSKARGVGFAPCKLAGRRAARCIRGSRICDNARVRRKAAADGPKNFRGRPSASTAWFDLSICSYIYTFICLFHKWCRACIARLGSRGGGPGSQPRYLLPTPANGGPGKSQMIKNARKTQEEKRGKIFRKKGCEPKNSQGCEPENSP